MQNLMDSHDTDRLASMIVNGEGTTYSGDQIEFNSNNNLRSAKNYEIRKPNDRERSIQRLVALLQMTYVGAPMIYYGTEAGMWGAHDPDDRMPMVWADMKYDPQTLDPREGRERRPDEIKFDDAMFAFYKAAIALRKDHPALNHGEYAVLATDDVQRAFVFTRRSPKETLVVALNRGDQPATIDLHLASSSIKPIFVTQGALDDVKATVTAGGAKLVVPALTGVVLGYN
jgi:glycosidase